MCQCLDCGLFTAVVPPFLLVSDNIPCPSLRALRHAWAGSRVGQLDPLLLVYNIVSMDVKYGFYLKTVVLKPLGLTTSLDV